MHYPLLIRCVCLIGPYSLESAFKPSLYSYNNVSENILIDRWLSKLDGKTYDLDIKGIINLNIDIIQIGI